MATGLYLGGVGAMILFRRMINLCLGKINCIRVVLRGFIVFVITLISVSAAEATVSAINEEIEQKTGIFSVCM